MQGDISFEEFSGGQPVKMIGDTNFEDFSGGKPVALAQDEEIKTQEQKPGWFQSIIQGFSKPVLDTAATAASAVKGIGGVVNAGIDNLVGNKEQAKKNLENAAEPVKINAGYFGTGKPIGVDDNGKPISTVETIKKASGTGAELASFVTANPVIAGAEYFGGQAAVEGKSSKEIVLNAAGGAAFGKAGEVVGKVVSKIPETAWNALLKRSPAVAAKNPQLSKQISKEGILGITQKGLASKLGQRIQETELKIADALEGQKGEISTWNVVQNLRDLYTHYSQIPGEKASMDKIIEIGNAVMDRGATLTVQEANQVKRDIYQMVAKSYGKGLMEIPAKTEAQKAIARGLKLEIEKVIPEVKDLNAQQAIYLQAKNAIEKRMAREEGKGIAGTGIGLFDLMVGGGTGAIYGPMMGLQVAIAKKIAESPVLQTTVAAGTQKIINMFDSMSPTQKIIFYNGLRGIADSAISSNKK